MSSQDSKIGKIAGLELLGQFRRQRSLAAALMRKGEQLDCDLACQPFRRPVNERLEGTSVLPGDISTNDPHDGGAGDV